MSFIVDFRLQNTRKSVLHIQNEDTYEEISIHIPLVLEKTEGGSYTWYNGPNDFWIKIENYSDEEDDRKEVSIHTTDTSFRMFYTDDACEEIMGHLDRIVQRTNERKMAGELAVAKGLPPHFGKVIGQYAGRRRTMKKRK